MPGDVDETYAAALRHGLFDSGSATLVGVVRRPTSWFRAAVHENVPALGPPADLLDEVQAREEALKMQGVCESGAHNAAFEEADFEARYREHLSSGAAADAVADLRARLDDGEDLVLVCYENTDDKRCHRTTLADVLEG
ncbi:MAG: DUF488 family protein [Halobacteriaceae archaeon]